MSSFGVNYLADRNQSFYDKRFGADRYAFVAHDDGCCYCDDGNDGDDDSYNCWGDSCGGCYSDWVCNSRRLRRRWRQRPSAGHCWRGHAAAAAGGERQGRLGSGPARWRPPAAAAPAAARTGARGGAVGSGVGGGGGGCWRSR